MKRIVTLAGAAISLFASQPSFANLSEDQRGVDFDTASTQAEWDEVCQNLYKVAVWAAQERDTGVNEDLFLRYVDDQMKKEGHGNETRHVMAITIKGAYSNPDEDGDAYAARIQQWCQIRVR